MVRKSQDAADLTRLAILKAAKAHFAQNGYADSSLQAIAQDSGVTKGGLLHHFPSKETLFLAVWTSMQRDMDSEARQVAIAARSKDDPYAAFLAGCSHYLNWATRPDYQRIVLIDGPSVLGADRWYALDQKLGEENVTAGIRYLMKQDIIREGEARPMAILVQNALNGAGFALSRQAEGVTRQALWASFERLVRSLG
jgi:AcrR family transcriptional regulator